MICRVTKKKIFVTCNVDDDDGINEDSDNARLYLFDSDNNGNKDNE